MKEFINKIINKIKNNKKLVSILVSMIVVITVLMNSTYSLLVKNDTTQAVSYATGVLNITSSAVNDSVTLTNSLPMTDTDGIMSAPYTFRITNVGNLVYKFNVKFLSTIIENQVSSQYIKFTIDGGEIQTLDSLTDGLILEDIILVPGSSIELDLRVWLDNNTPNTEIGKVFNAKIVTEGYAINDKSYISLTNLLYNDEFNSQKLMSFDGTSESDNTSGIYATEDDIGTSYYFRGDVTNNYVYFAGFYWRIIRVNGDGTVRMIYDGKEIYDNNAEKENYLNAEIAFNDDTSDNANVGYMYGSSDSGLYGDTHLNTNNSNVKTVLDNWYKTNIVDAGYSDYVADAIYCNDRSVSTGTGIADVETTYSSYSRNYGTVATPTLKCAQSNDRFTIKNSNIVTTDGNGTNGALTYPIGLITADELIFSGYHSTASSVNYLYNNFSFSYWTMSPAYYSNGAYLSSFSANGLEAKDVVYNENLPPTLVRPVISLKYDAIESGTGLKSDPFTVGVKDNSGANRPKLTDGLIPVVYDFDTGSWLKANPNSTASRYGWYNYDQKKWANAVLVKDTGHVQSLNEKDKVVSISFDSVTDGVYYKTSYEKYEITDTGVYNLTNSVSSTVFDSVGNWICSDGTSTSCSEIYKIIDSDGSQITKVNSYGIDEITRDTYENADAGMPITQSDILAFYVWIPRYKYKVWNIDRVASSSQYGYDAYNNGIDIIFENGTNSTGTITCDDYDFSVVASDNVLYETCHGANGDYFTHPAFTFGDEELTGFWMGKFELSCEKSSYSDSCSYNNTSPASPRILPNVYAWIRNSATGYHYVLTLMQKSGNIYGLTTDLKVADTHLIRNMEWGAVAYLTNSEYGSCTDGSCKEVGLNSSGAQITGCGPQTLGDNSNSGDICNAYDSFIGQTGSTTGNIYGVYDMNGGSYEYVMGNASLTEGKYDYNVGGSSSTYFSYTAENEKYLDTYGYGTTSSNQVAYNRGRLGDGTSEFLTSSGYTWYGDWGYMVYTARPWFLRGDYVSDTTGAGVFAFDFFTGDTGWSGVSARGSLVVY